MDTQNGAPPPLLDLNSTFGFTKSNISNYVGKGTVTYSGSQIANFATVDDFLASGGSASEYRYGSWYSFDLGVLSPGTSLTIGHDDGVSVYQKGVLVTGTDAGPTSLKTEKVILTETGDTVLYYSRQNGTPSILNVAVPEPLSVALLGSGLVGLGMIRRRRSRAAA